MKQKFYCLFSVLCFVGFQAIAQPFSGKPLTPHVGKNGIKKKVAELRSMGEPVLLSKPDAVQDTRSASSGMGAAGIAGSEKNIAAQQAANGVLPETAMGNALNQIVGSNFLSIYREHAPGQPGTVPDPSGAVGPGHVAVVTNMGIRVFEKPLNSDDAILTPSGYSAEVAPAFLSMTLSQFFAPVLPANSSAVHPQIRYDRLSRRWFVSAVEENLSKQKNLILLAVSDGDQFTDASVFTFFGYNSSLFPFNESGPAPYFDVPTLGVDRHSVLIGGTQFGPDSANHVAYIINKAALVRGQLLVYPVQLGVMVNATGTMRGMAYPTAVSNDDPASPSSFFIGLVAFSSPLYLVAIQYTNQKAPFWAYQNTITVPLTNFPREISTPGSMAPLYTFPITDRRNRLLQAVISKNKVTGAMSLWTAQNVGTNVSGGFIPPAQNIEYIRQARTASRWYQISGIYSTTPQLEQSGTVFDDRQFSGRRARQYFNATIAANGQGHALVSGTTAAYNEFLNVYATGRLFTDAAGFTYPPATLTDATAIYAPFLFDRNAGGRGQRIFINGWGDYSQTVIDPLDDQTFWTFQQYANVDDGYGIRVVQFKAPPPATPVALQSLSNREDTTVLINGNSSFGSGFFDPGTDRGGPGYERLTVKSTGGILVSNVKWLSPTQISVKVHTNNKPVGNYLLIITNPDGQFVVANYSIQAAAGLTATGRRAVVVTKGSNLLGTGLLKTSIAPNPTSLAAILTVTADVDVPSRLSLIDANGQQVHSQSVLVSKGNNTINLPMEQLVAGTYFALLYDRADELLAIQKVVKL